MAYNAHTPIYGVSEIGDYTGAKAGPYTENPWGLTTQAGGVITMNTNVIKQYSGQGAAALDSFVQTVDGTFAAGLLSATLNNMRKLFGQPLATLTGDLAPTAPATPTQEVLSVRGDAIGTLEQSLYMRTMGPLGPRSYRMPRAKVSNPSNITHGREGYFNPNATFDLYEDPTTGDFFFVEDPPA